MLRLSDSDLLLSNFTLLVDLGNGTLGLNKEVFEFLFVADKLLYFHVTLINGLSYLGQVDVIQDETCFTECRRVEAHHRQIVDIIED